MGFLDLFKRRKKEEKLEKIKLGDLDRWILNKKEEVENKKNALSNLIKEKIIQLTQESEKNIETLEKIDFKKMKVEEKAKIMVRENLNYYVKYLNEFSKSDLLNRERIGYGKKKFKLFFKKH